MMAVLVTQKTNALPVIIAFGAVITIFQIFYARGGLKRKERKLQAVEYPLPGLYKPVYESGIQRAQDQARQRGIADAVEDMLKKGAFAKFNVGPDRVETLVSYLFNVDPSLFHRLDSNHHERTEEPSVELEQTYQAAYSEGDEIFRVVESYSHFGIFTFINNYYINWVDTERGRDASIVQRAMLDILFPMTEHDIIWSEFREFEPQNQPEEIWQFSRRRYLWAKDQWPNLSDRITTIWTLQDFDLLSRDIDVKTVISVAGGKQQMLVKIPPRSSEKSTDAPKGSEAN
jgi:hypothetical protein